MFKLFLLCIFIMSCDEVQGQKEQLSQAMVVNHDIGIITAAIAEVCEEHAVCSDNIWLPFDRKPILDQDLTRLNKIKDEIYSCEFKLKEKDRSEWKINIAKKDHCPIAFVYSTITERVEKKSKNSIAYSLESSSLKRLMEVHAIEMKAVSEYKETRGNITNKSHANFKIKSHNYGNVRTVFKGDGTGNGRIYKTNFLIDMEFENFSVIGDYYQKEVHDGSGTIIDGKYKINGRTVSKQRFSKIFPISN